MSGDNGRECPLEAGLLSARDVIAWRYQWAKARVPQLPPAAILTHQSSLLGRRRPWLRDRSLDLLSFDARLLHSGSRPTLLAGCRSIGAPATAVVIEELAVLGTQRIVMIDVAGSLDPALMSGDVVLVREAIAADGTTPHYTSETRVSADTGLTGELAAALSGADVSFALGTVWSTDAVYRETVSELRRARQEGASLADMETASILAVAGSLGIAAGGLLVVADELTEGWKPPGDMTRLRAQLRRLLAVARTALMP